MLLNKETKQLHFINISLTEQDVLMFLLKKGSEINLDKINQVIYLLNIFR